MSDKVSAKLKELIDIAEQEGDNDAQICLLILEGARFSGDDGLLASIMQDIAKNILLPLVMEKNQAEKN